jgi:hypothetical protein
MAQSRESVEEAIALGSESAEEVEAALSEKDRGGPAVSLGLLMSAIEKERDSLDLMEQGVETLRQALEERRRSLELQQQVLLELSECMQREQEHKEGRTKDGEY